MNAMNRYTYIYKVIHSLYLNECNEQVYKHIQGIHSLYLNECNEQIYIHIQGYTFFIFK